MWKNCRKERAVGVCIIFMQESRNLSFTQKVFAAAAAHMSPDCNFYCVTAAFVLLQSTELKIDSCQSGGDLHFLPAFFKSLTSSFMHCKQTAGTNILDGILPEK